MLLVNRKSILPSALPRFEFGLPSAACGSEGLVYETSHVFNDAKAIGSLHFDAFDRPTDQNARSDIIGGRNRKIPLYDRGYDVKHYPILANADRMGGADISRRMTGYGDVSVKIYTIQNASAALPLELAMELYPRNLTHPNVASLYTAGLVSAPPYSSGVSGVCPIIPSIFNGSTGDAAASGHRCRGHADGSHKIRGRSQCTIRDTTKRAAVHGVSAGVCRDTLSG